MPTVPVQATKEATGPWASRPPRIPNAAKPPDLLSTFNRTPSKVRWRPAHRVFQGRPNAFPSLPPDANIFASKYQLYLPPNEELKAELEQITRNL